VQTQHATLPLGFTARQAGLHPLDVCRVDRRKQPISFGPRFLGGVAADHVDPQAVLQLPPNITGQPANPVEFLANRGRRFPPGEVDVSVFGRNRTCGSRRSSEEHRWHRVGPVVQRRTLDPDVVSGERHRRFRRPQLPHHIQKLAGADVPRLFVQKIPIGPLLMRFTTGDDVEQQSTARVPLIRRRHLRGQRRAE
jgi:hypothetical protein